MSYKLRLGALAFLAMGATTAIADGPPPMPEPPSFAELDADGDQMVTEEEFYNHMRNRMAEREPRGDRRGGRFDPFGRADADGDGVLTEQEFDDMMEHMRHMRPPGKPPGDFPPPHEIGDPDSSA